MTDKLDDVEWALSICDDYVLPHIKAAKPESYRYLSRQLVLDRVILIWIKGGKDDKAIETLSQTLDEDPIGTNADATRMRLAQVYEKDEKYQEAIDTLQEIDDKGDLAGAKQYIPELEKKLRGEQQ